MLPLSFHCNFSNCDLPFYVDLGERRWEEKIGWLNSACSECADGHKLILHSDKYRSCKGVISLLLLMGTKMSF